MRPNNHSLKVSPVLLVSIGAGAYRGPLIDSNCSSLSSQGCSDQARGLDIFLIVTRNTKSQFATAGGREQFCSDSAESSSHLNAVCLDLVVQRLTADAEPLGGIELIAAGFVKHLNNGLALHSLEQGEIRVL